MEAALVSLAHAGCGCSVHGLSALFELFRPILQRKSFPITAFSHFYSPCVRSQWHKRDTRAPTITRKERATTTV
jgi:hypothetical protein